jgi:tellurite resistance protein TerC
MPAPVPITFWHWAAFILVILIFLALDLGALGRSSQTVKRKDALAWSAVWFLLALLFAGGIQMWRGPAEALEFVTGYFIEFSLSIDNVAAIALVFASFAVPPPRQHRVLLCGILGALVMRGLMIGLGAALIQRFHWVLYAFGVFLVFTGVKWGFTRTTALPPRENAVIRLARRIFPVSSDINTDKFLTRLNGRRAWTPLALVLLMIETTDLLFAVDSIPAIFAVTQKPFIVFTSNIFAILGLRSLYFAVAGAIQYFRFLKAGLAAALIFVGVKMLVSVRFVIPTGFSLGVVAALIAGSIALSILLVRPGKRA